MAGWIVVVRYESWGLLHHRSAVIIDGRRVARLRRDATQDFMVEAGVHQLRVRQIGYPSKTLEVSVADGEAVVVRTRMRFWATYVTSLFASFTGGIGFWLFAQGPTLPNVVGFSVGLVGLVTLLAARVAISLRPDPAPIPYAQWVRPWPPRGDHELDRAG
ncbi:hypothetical protein ABIA31_007834 [Catenulispora sp. MAP5-51]|uniref:hypothetical protein n=1 Tax=Catenulispora sp. MAP5-51 TaxID=3156298 RepID=UPI0035112441